MYPKNQNEKKGTKYKKERMKRKERYIKKKE